MQFWKPKSELTPEQKQFWNENGFLVLSGFFPAAEVQAVNRVVDRIIANPDSLGNATVDVLHGAHIGKRFRGGKAPKEAFHGPIKINDLFLQEPEVRNLALNRRLTQVLSELLEGAPMVCNSLNFLWGSQQPDHFDSWYMPPPVENKMVVSSICLEDVHPEAGPLVYYPGSHKIPPYRFFLTAAFTLSRRKWTPAAPISRNNCRVRAPSGVYFWAKPETCSFGTDNCCTAVPVSKISAAPARPW